MSDTKTPAPPLINTPTPGDLPRQQAGRQANSADCPMDMTPQELTALLAKELRAGNVSGGHIRHLSNGHVEFCFRLKEHSNYPQPWAAGPLAADWMRANHVLLRREFFEKYPAANNSASLHDRALRILERKGEIVKDHGLWVWKEKGQ